jgi:small-conductance mechanosensitive channel
VRLISFGDSSLDFELLFFSKKIFRIGKMKSDIRININNKFAENNVVIPFPQMDLHVNKQDHK